MKLSLTQLQNGCQGGQYCHLHGFSAIANAIHGPIEEAKLNDEVQFSATILEKLPPGSLSDLGFRARVSQFETRRFGRFERIVEAI